ncbi:MAG: DUF4384 domain-containing protein [Paramuribaculum sp.]|nr:DUF4384 domain-containing protein [Paramuribaculum sp.]
MNDNDNLTLKEAKIKCVESAKLEALKKEFGTLVTSVDMLSDKVVNDVISSVFLSDVSSTVKGEWLGDERDPEISIEYVDGNLVFTAKVWGRAREVIRATTDVKWHIQKDLDGVKIDSDNFMDGERIFVRFQSPADGYVAIYLVTDDQTVCLLPYRKDNTGRYKIKGGKEYLFFDRTVDPSASYYKLNTDKPLEYNQLVMIFSPNPFTKCIDKSGDILHLNALNQTDFAKWLLKNQRADKEMMIERRWLAIQEKNTNNQ